MTGQTDPHNMQSFLPGPTTERVLYFGVYLDINQDGARLPATYVAAHPDEPAVIDSRPLGDYRRFSSEFLT